MHINEFQDLMRRLYFHRDAQRGIERTFEWLVEEVAELGEAIQAGNKESLEQEFADVIAWLASLANVTHINLEEAAAKKYSNMCPKCRASPCQCPL